MMARRACEGHLTTTLRATAFEKPFGKPVRSARCIPDVTQGPEVPVERPGACAQRPEATAGRLIMRNPHQVRPCSWEYSGGSTEQVVF